MTGTEHEPGQQYYLVFPGNILPGSDYQQSIIYLADLLKTSLYKAKKLVSGKKRYIKQKFDLRQAETLRDQILELGVECELKAIQEDGKSYIQKHHSKSANKKTSTTTASQDSIQQDPAGKGYVKPKSYSEVMNDLQSITDGLLKGKAEKKR